MSMLTVRGDHEAPTLEQAAKLLSIDVRALDSSYGVQLIDPVGQLYVVRTILGTVLQRPPDERGPFSDPRIATFGPPRGS